MSPKATKSAWITFALIGAACLVLGALSGFAAIYSNEAGIDLTKPPVTIDAKEYGNSHVIWVPTKDVIQLDGDLVEMAILEKRVLNIMAASAKPPVFVLRMNRDLQFGKIIELKDMLDRLEAKSLIELQGNQ